MNTLNTIEIQCQSCGATLTLEPQLRTAQCPYCDSPAVIERPTSEERPAPSFVLGFVIDRARAVEKVGDSIKSRGFFAHSGLKRAVLEKTRGVYLPAYLYGAIAHTRYDVEIGENYTVVETYTTTDAQGRTRMRRRTRTKTEWCPLPGTRSGYVLDVVVTASRGIPNSELEAVEPFDLRALRRYSPALLSGWIAEEPSLGRDECLRMAHDESIERVGQELASCLPGDGQRNLSCDTELVREVIDLVLIPVWVVAARYAEGKPPLRVLLNGQTGRIHGNVPLSGGKIAGTVFLVIALAALFYLLLKIL